MNLAVTVAAVLLPLCLITAQMEKAQISSLLNTLLPQTLVDFLSHTPKKGGGGKHKRTHKLKERRR